MQFYNYELSQWYPIEFGANGLFQIQSKKSYWANPNTYPCLIRVGEAIAGFAVVDNETTAPQSIYNLGYFFIARRYRSKGVGTTAFRSLLQSRPGAWEVYHLAQNVSAEQFWPLALAKAKVNNLTTSTEVIHSETSILHRFTVANSSSRQ